MVKLQYLMQSYVKGIAKSLTEFRLKDDANSIVLVKKSSAIIVFNVMCFFIYNRD